MSFDPEDYQFTADLLRQHSRDDKPALFQAVCSNNLNIILAALDQAAAAPDLLAALKDGLSLKGGWREAIVELEDWCHEPVRLKNMLAAADQLDRWATAARAAIAKAEGAP